MRRLSFLLAFAISALAQNPCERLKSLSLPNTTITAAESRATAANVPAHCRVAAVLTPSPDSHIEIEVWMPSSGWNGKFEAVGNGGWARSDGVAANAAPPRAGYAPRPTHTGHKTPRTPRAFLAPNHSAKLL